MVTRKLQGNNGFRKAKRSKGSFVTDRVRTLISSVCLFVCFFGGFILHLIAGYTIDMSKSNQGVHGFLTFTAIVFGLQVTSSFSKIQN